MPQIVMFCIHGNLLLTLNLGIHELPDPVLDDDGHYQCFDKVYGTVAKITYIPSEKQQTGKVFLLMPPNSMLKM